MPLPLLRRGNIHTERVNAMTRTSSPPLAPLSQPIQPGTLLLDLNSASPGTKKSCAAWVDAAQGRYVEAGVTSTVKNDTKKTTMMDNGKGQQCV